MLASDKTTFLLSIWLIEQALYQRDVVLVPPHAMFSSHLHVPTYAMNEQSELLAFAKSIQFVSSHQPGFPFAMLDLILRSQSSNRMLS